MGKPSDAGVSNLRAGDAGDASDAADAGGARWQ